MLIKLRTHAWWLVLLATGTLLACNLFTPAPTPTPTASFTATPTITATPMPPIAPHVIDYTPVRGDELPVDGRITVYFDTAMDRASVQSAFKIDPPVAGDFSWPDDSTLVFAPAAQLDRAARYAVSIAPQAKSEAGLNLAEAASFKAETVGFLEVTQVLPAADTFGAAVDSVITIMFNRPVAPLTALADQAGFPSPLTLNPPVEGKGEWLNTSIYVFHPAQPLAGGVTYIGRVAAGLADTTGGLLKDDFSWTFTTQPPEVVTSNPFDGMNAVVLSPVISFTFNQPMQHAATEAAFHLQAPDGSAARGAFTWAAGDTEFGFRPQAALALGAQYLASVDTTALSAGGAALSQAYAVTFNTVRPPDLLNTDPGEGADYVQLYNGFRAYFTSPMDVESVNQAIHIEPAPTQVYTYWNESDFNYYIGWDMAPSTDYVVTIDGGMRDPYGNTIANGQVVHFRTAPLEPQAYFNTGSMVGTYNAAFPSELYVTTVNQDEVRLKLYRLTLEQFAAMTGPDSYQFFQNYSPNEADQVRAWSVPVINELNQHMQTKINLLEDGSSLAPGLYYISLAANTVADSYHLMVVSGANLTLKSGFTQALVWATDLNSGQPLANYPVAVYDQNFRRVAEGRTDADGLFETSLTGRPDLWTQIYAVSQGGQLASGLDGFAVTVSDWTDGVNAWDFGLSAEYYPRDLVGYLYTDRPMYRPGQTVYFKGILRREDDARFGPSGLKTIQVTISNDQGEQVYDSQRPVSDYGSFSGEFQLSGEAGLGYYYLSINDEKAQIVNNSLSFSVAEYRKPEFQVSVTSPQTQTLAGSSIAVQADASFYFGGPVSKADVHWSVLSADYVFPYAGPGNYDFYNYDYSSGQTAPQYGAYGRLVTSKDTQTDANGRSTLQVSGDLFDSGLSQLYTLEAQVTDPAGGQQVAGRVEVVVHQGQFYVGSHAQQYVGFVGQPVGFDLLTVDWNSQAFPNQKLHVVFNDHQWNCALEKDPDTGVNQWACHVKDTEVSSADVTTGADGKATASFTPSQGGVYQALVSGVDASGHTVTTSSLVWVADANSYITWRQEDSNRINLVADRTSYRPGDTAEILIPSPFQGEAVALVTIERGGILKREVIRLTNNSTVYRLPITADYAPDVFFSVVVIKGVDATAPTAAFKVGLAELKVSPEQQAISLSLTPDKARVGPRDTVTYAIRATDYEGKPVQAEFSVGLADLAALSLSAPNSGPILEAFYGERGLGMRTSLGLVNSVDKLNLATARAKGGGGGGGAGFDEVRTQFLDTAFWQAVVQTDAQGQASITLKLPDNLTTWRLDVRAVSMDTRVGQATVDIVATKDLLIRPVTPRFFVVGDQARLGAVINNNTDQDIAATVSLAGTGVALTSPAEQQVTVKAHDRLEVNWNVTAQDAPAADLTFSVKGGGLQDASKPTLGLPPNQTLPIYKYSAPETAGTAGQLNAGESVLEAVSLPRRFDVTQGDLTIQLQPSLAAAMTGGLDYLEHFPYECTEQTVSRFLPNVLSYRALKQLNLVQPELEANLQELVNTGLQRLYARQHVDGGWGWWTTDASDVYLTAYVVSGLTQAKAAGFEVHEGALNSGTAFLREQLVTPDSSREDWELNRQAYVLYVLAEAGVGRPSETVRLYESRERLATYARAYLALAFHTLDANDTRVATLLSDINNAAIVSATGAHWEETQPDWWNMNTDTRSTAIVLDTLARLDPQNALAPNVVRWLMTARRASAWETTQETAWALMGLTDWMVASGELNANYSYKVDLNGQALTSGTAGPDNLRATVTLQVAVADLLRDQANRLVIGRTEGDGRLYYTAHLNLYLPAPEVPALSRGIIVARQYTLVSPDCGAAGQPACAPITQARAGQDIQVKVTLIAPHDLYYVVLEDPIPAGAEAIDTNLLTTSVVGQPPELNSADPLYYGWGWWWFSNIDLRDEKAVLFANYLPRGTYEYTYRLHASLPGAYQVIPTSAQEFYEPEVFGRGEGSLFTIQP